MEFRILLENVIRGRVDLPAEAARMVIAPENPAAIGVVWILTSCFRSIFGVAAKNRGREEPGASTAPRREGVLFPADGRFPLIRCDGLL